MSFGFGIGDAIGCVQLGSKLYNQFSGSPGVYLQLVSDADDLSRLLQRVEEIDKRRILKQAERSDLLKQIQSCQDVLQRLRKMLEKHQSLATQRKRFRDRMTLDVEGAKEIGAQITRKVTGLNGWLNYYLISQTDSLFNAFQDLRVEVSSGARTCDVQPPLILEDAKKDACNKATTCEGWATMECMNAEVDHGVVCVDVSRMAFSKVDSKREAISVQCLEDDEKSLYYDARSIIESGNEDVFDLLLDENKDTLAVAASNFYGIDKDEFDLDDDGTDLDEQEAHRLLCGTVNVLTSQLLLSHTHPTGILLWMLRSLLASDANELPDVELANNFYECDCEDNLELGVCSLKGYVKRNESNQRSVCDICVDFLLVLCAASFQNLALTNLFSDELVEVDIWSFEDCMKVATLASRSPYFVPFINSFEEIAECQGYRSGTIPYTMSALDDGTFLIKPIGGTAFCPAEAVVHQAVTRPALISPVERVVKARLRERLFSMWKKRRQGAKQKQLRARFIPSDRITEIS